MSKSLTTITTLGACLALAGCGLDAPTGAPADSTTPTTTITSAGSSTLGPLTQAIVDRYRVTTPQTQVTVDITSTGDGLKALCAGSLDFANASRRITDEERKACEAQGITYTEILAANDAISLVVSKGNGWAKCLTTAELKKMWEPAAEGTVTTWQQVRDGWPAEALKLYGPDSTSGTLDTFTTQITGKDKAIRSDYTPSKDDHVTLQGVRKNKGGVGFLGLSYVMDNTDLVRPVAVDNGQGCIQPTAATVRDGSYAPLSRPLYVYVNNASMTKPEMKSFMRYYVQWARNIAVDTNFVPMTESQLTTAKAELAKAEG